MGTKTNLNADKAEVVHPQKKTSAPFRQFETKEDWQSEIDRIIGQRLKEKRENESAQDKYYRLSKLVKYYFGTEDVRSLQSIFANMKRAAMAQSLVQQAEEKQLASGIDERKQQAEQSVLRYAQENGREISELTDNPIFLRYLWDMGLEAEEADLLANKDKLKEDALERAKESIAASILAKKERIAENGAQGAQGAKKRKISPKSLTNADIDDILARVKNGEHITF